MATGQNRVPIIEKMMALLTYLGEHPEGETISSLGRKLDIPKTTTYRILYTLQAHELVQQTESGRFRLGTRLLTLAGSQIQQLDHVREATPIMSELAYALQETVKLTVLDGDQVIVVARVESPAGLGITTQIGRRFPLHAGAASKLLLAHLPEGQIDRLLTKGLKKFTRNTITDPEVMKENLRRIRRDGWALDNAEYVEGVWAVAAPVRDLTGQVIGALSVPFFSSTDESRIDELRTAVCAGAAQLSKRLGYSSL